MGRRARLDTGRLGMVAVTRRQRPPGGGLLRRTRDHGLTVLDDAEVVVDADAAQIPVGIDGEAVIAADAGALPHPPPGAAGAGAAAPPRGPASPAAPQLGPAAPARVVPPTARVITVTGHDSGGLASGRALLTTLDRARVELGALDRAVYAAVASTPSPTIDAAVARISNAANYSRLWMVTAGVLAATGPTRRRAALIGLTAVGATSAVSNLVVKPAMSRGRPERTDSGRSQGVRMPESHSFPSGHTASAFAFSSAVGGELPALATPLRADGHGRRLLARAHRRALPRRRGHRRAPGCRDRHRHEAAGPPRRMGRGQWAMSTFSSTIETPSSPASAVTPTSRIPDSPAPLPAARPCTSSSSTVVMRAA